MKSAIFFGSSEYVLPVIDKLREKYNLALIITTEKNPTDAIPAYCKKNGIQYLFANTLKNDKIIAKIKSLGCEIGILAYFGLIVPQEVLDIFPKGIINIHPSLLPKYRGPTPGASAILNNDHQTGVTIILLDNMVDHGPILIQEKIEIEENDTADKLYSKLFTLGATLLMNILPDYLKGKIKPNKQEENKATYTPKLTRESGYINTADGKWQMGNDLGHRAKGIELMAKNRDEIKRAVRAYYPWPGVWTRFDLNHNGQIKIIKFLPKEKIQVEGKKPMTVKDFINGYKNSQPLLKKLGVTE